MNFQNLQKIENSRFYLDLAFRNAKQNAQSAGRNAKNKLEKSRLIELQKIRIVRKILMNGLARIIESFPKIDELPDFYRELVKVSMDYSELKLSFGAVNWARKHIERICNSTINSIKRAKDISTLNKNRRALYGRVSSIMKQIETALVYLESCRRIMKEFPTIKTGIFTAAIVGYPNVGKSSILRAISSARPKVDSYPFTTKGINIGYLNLDGSKIQIIDVPGTFDREFNEMNNIEKQSVLVVRHVAHLLIFVFDSSESCGYSIKEQRRLFARLKKYGKPIITVWSKSDLSRPAEKGIALSTLTGEGIKTLISAILSEENKTKSDH